MSYPSPRDLKEDGGFWLPNDVIDVHLPVIRARGLACYCCVVRASTRYHYPGVVDLACSLRLTERKVDQLLDQLAGQGLLNPTDLEAIRGAL